MKSLESITQQLDDLEKRAHRAIQAAAEGRTSLDSAKAEVEAVHRQIEYIQHDRDKQHRLAVLSPGEHPQRPYHSTSDTDPISVRYVCTSCEHVFYGDRVRAGTTIMCPECRHTGDGIPKRPNGTVRGNYTWHGDTWLCRVCGTPEGWAHSDSCSVGPQRPQRPDPRGCPECESPVGGAHNLHCPQRPSQVERVVGDVWLVNGDTAVRCSCRKQRTLPGSHEPGCNVARVARGEGLRRKGFRKPKPLTDHERTEVKAMMLLRSEDPVGDVLAALEDPTDELIEDIEEELERTAPPTWEFDRHDEAARRTLFEPPLLWKNPEAYAIMPSTTGGAPRATLVTEYLDYPPRLLEAVEPPMTAERQYAEYVEAKRSAGTTRVDPVASLPSFSTDNTIEKQQCDVLGHVEVAGSDHCLRCMLSKHEQWIRANSLDIH